MEVPAPDRPRQRLLRRKLRLAGWAAVVVLLLAVTAIALAYPLSEARLNRVYTIPADNLILSVRDEETFINRGEKLVEVQRCATCHGPDFGGSAFLDMPLVATIYGANLTRGQGELGSTLSDEEMARAIRHGVGPDGKPLVGMPANNFAALNDADLGAMIAYIRTRPVVDRAVPVAAYGPVGRLLLVTGVFPPLPAEVIDHAAVRPTSAAPGISAAYGRYLAAVCAVCHGSGFSGGSIPGEPPGYPPAANLTPGGELATWSEADFLRTIRTGITPGRHLLNNAYMPWQSFAHFTDDELRAIWLFLTSLPARPAGSR